MGQRWAIHGQTESKVSSEGDRRFNGLDMTRDRSILEPGMLAVSQNKRLNNGIAATRPACDFPPDFNPGFTNQLLGSGVFSNPNGDEVLLVAESGQTFVWVLQYGKDPVQIPINADANPLLLSATFQVKFVQAFDHVLLLRRPAGGRPPLVWDGTYPPAGTAKFVAVTTTQTIPDVVIPNGCWNGEPFQERVLYYNDQFPFTIGTGINPDRDTILMSETDDYSAYDPAIGVFKINGGESNVLTSVMGYYRGGVLCFFRRGIHLLENFTNPSIGIGDQRMVNDFLGCVSNEGKVMVGVDVYFLSDPGAGVYRISEAVQDQIAVNPLAVSDPIQPFIDSINWPQATYWASMKTLGVYVYLAVPTDASTKILGTGNTQIAVYNQYTRQWESIDSFSDPKFSFQEMHVISLAGSTQNNQTQSPIIAPRRLIAVDWYRQQIYGLYWGNGHTDDEIGPGGQSFPINDSIETRGYTLGDPTMFKRFERTCFSIQTFAPELNLVSISDGYNEVKALNRFPVHKDRLHYYIHGKGKFIPGTSDPDAPKRMDYSVDDGTPSYVIEDFEGLPIGNITKWPGKQGSEILIGALQTSLERYQIRQNGRFASIGIYNTQGVCNITSVSVDGISVQEGIRVVA